MKFLFESRRRKKKAEKIQKATICTLGAISSALIAKEAINLAKSKKIKFPKTLDFTKLISKE